MAVTRLFIHLVHIEAPSIASEDGGTCVVGIELAWLLGCLLGCLVACLVASLLAWLLGCLVAWLLGCLLAWLLQTLSRAVYRICKGVVHLYVAMGVGCERGRGFLPWEWNDESTVRCRH